jgi:type I restriction enzyme, S subunit
MKDGWVTKKLAEVSAIRYGYTESASSNPIGPRFLRITDIQDDCVDWEHVPYCKIESEDLPKYRLASGDIVFARTGATTGKSFLVANPPDAIFASYLIRLRLVDKRLSPEFVSLFFQTSGYWQAIKDGSSGSAQGGFNASKLGDLSISIPPLPEQQRIVAILHEAFSSISTAKANAENNLRNARAIFESHLQAVFSQRGQGWVEKRLDEICTFSSGGTPSKQNASYWRGKIPWISGRDMKATRLADSYLHISKAAVQQSATRIARPGTLLILVRGMGLAHGAQIGELMVPSAFNQDIRGLDPIPELVPRFLLFALRYGINSSDTVLSNAAHGTLKIDSNELQKVRIPFPMRLQQERIVAVIDSLAEETERLAKIYERKLNALDALKRSMLHSAFAGELTANLSTKLVEAVA